MLIFSQFVVPDKYMNRIGHNMNVSGNLNFKVNPLVHLIACARILTNTYRPSACYLCFVNTYFSYSSVLKDKTRDVFGYAPHLEDLFDENGWKVQIVGIFSKSEGKTLFT